MAEVDLAELERYLRIFQENPDSRVFAPLADLYRRLGRLKEAEEIVKDGMERHPYYAGGRVAFANILLDSGRLEESLKEASQVVTYYPDNLLARKILIRVLGGLSQLERARHEYDALKALAPQIAADPDLERALLGPQLSQQLPETPRSPFVSQNPEAQNFERISSEKTKEAFPRAQHHEHNRMKLQEKTDWKSIDFAPRASPDATLHRSFRLKNLLKKKIILETWIQRLSEDLAEIEGPR